MMQMVRINRVLWFVYEIVPKSIFMIKFDIILDYIINTTYILYFENIFYLTQGLDEKLIDVNLYFFLTFMLLVVVIHIYVYII